MSYKIYRGSTRPRGWNDMIRLSKSCLSSEEKQAVLGVLDREYLGMGDEVRKLESVLTDYLQRPAVCVNSGTAALHLALEALELEADSEVLVPSLTYVASFQAITAAKLRPIPCEIDPETGILDLKDAEMRISAKTRVLMPVHYSGGVGSLSTMYDFAKKHQLRVVEDAAHAFGTRYEEKLIGSLGDVVCFSFDGIKNITCGEGGCVVTSDRRILDYIRDARLLGVINDTEKRYAGLRSWEFDVRAQGYRYHMSNIMAAIGVAQLERFDALSKRRKAIARIYQEAFSKHPRVTLLSLDYDEVVPHIFVVKVPAEKRDAVRDAMAAEGVQTGVHYFPNHLLFKFRRPELPALPQTESFFKQIITLPLHPDLNDADVNTVVESLFRALR